MENWRRKNQTHTHSHENSIPFVCVRECENENYYKYEKPHLNLLLFCLKSKCLKLISMPHSGICFQFFKTFGAQNEIIFQRIATILIIIIYIFFRSFSLSLLLPPSFSLTCLFGFHIKRKLNSDQNPNLSSKARKSAQDKTKLKRRFQIDLRWAYFVVHFSLGRVVAGNFRHWLSVAHSFLSLTHYLFRRFVRRRRRLLKA